MWPQTMTAIANVNGYLWADPATDPGKSPTSHLSAACWATVANLLIFFCLAHLGLIVCFAAGWRVPAYVAPAALICALACGDWLARREGIAGRSRITPAAAALAILGVSLLLCGAFFDMSWDGLWYHQTAIYQMAHGWNPLRDPLHTFIPSLQDYVRYYAKGPWYVSLAFYQFSPHIEWAKPAPWMAMAAMFLAVLAGLLDFGVRRRTAIVIAILVSINPVVVFELDTYLVDGLLVSYLACYVVAVARYIRRPSPLVLAIVVAAAILCANTKFSGFVYLCFFCAAAGVYLLMRQRRLIARYSAINVAAFVLATCVFGFNPYVTNTVQFGHPFYPWFGTAAHPSYAQHGRDPNDMYETPKNLLGRNRLVRFAYALFGRPGAEPYFPGRDAHLMWPFDVGWRDFDIFYFPDVRVSGFGPLFSGAFLIALVLLGAALVRPGLPREVLILFVGTVVASLLVGLHLWWARYGPQLWWLPIMAVAASLAVPGWRAVRWVAWSLAALLLVNAVAVEARHYVWEWQATRTTYQQIALLRQKGEVEIDFQYFLEPYEERLRAAGVAFRASRTLHCAKPMELMSVPHGYPGVVRACVPE
jgi:hypothetical protein